MSALYRAKAAGLTIDDMQHMSITTFELFCSYHEWIIDQQNRAVDSARDDDAAARGEAAFFGI